MDDDGWRMAKTRDAPPSPSTSQPRHRANVSSPALWLYKGHEIKMDKHVNDSLACCEKTVAYM